MSEPIYYLLCGGLILGILAGIHLMSKVERAVLGNLLSAVCTALAVLLTLVHYHILSDFYLWVFMAIGLVWGLLWAARIKMIQMPQVVALLNGLGGAASAAVAAMTILGGSLSLFEKATGALALAIGMITLTGSLIAAGKLHKLLPQQPIVLRFHPALTALCLALSLAAAALVCIAPVPTALSVALCTLLPAVFGVVFAIRVGGADMPITISLLNSLSGVAGAIAGMALGDPLLVAVGGIVGASGLLLTQMMCSAMNRKLLDILLGKTASPSAVLAAEEAAAPPSPAAARDAAQVAAEETALETADPVALLKAAQKVILIPGYGMALAQAQALVKELCDLLEGMGKEVEFAIHPVAGRMPGHMNVLLCEVDIPYEKLHEMEEINPRFPDCDVAIIVGANDVVNPAARSAQGTPIYGMPVLRAELAKHVIVCNYDLKPGYAGVENPLYTKKNGVTLLLGDAQETLRKLIGNLRA